jgi:hypothetical protein
VLAGLGKILHGVAEQDYAIAFVSEVMSTPDGPMVLFDAKGMSDGELDRALAALVRSAGEAGLTGGRIEVSPEGRLVNDLEFVDRAVIGAALPPPLLTRVGPPGELPERWRDIAADWLREFPSDPLVAEIVAVEASLDWDQLDAYLRSEGTRGEFRISSGSVRAPCAPCSRPSRRTPACRS